MPRPQAEALAAELCDALRPHIIKVVAELLADPDDCWIEKLFLSVDEGLIQFMAARVATID